jgi:hypothetical protein
MAQHRINEGLSPTNHTNGIINQYHPPDWAIWTIVKISETTNPKTIKIYNQAFSSL